MRSRSAGVAALAVVCLAIVPARADEPALATPICWQAPRVYHPGGAQAAELEAAATRALRIEHAPGPLAPPHTLSPNGAYAFRYTEQPNLGAPSGSTRVELLVFNEKNELLALRADDVQSLHDVRWLNEKLISFRLWLSRLGGVDALLDVEQERLVRLEAFADGTALWQQARESCQDNPELAGCDASCGALAGVVEVDVSDGRAARGLDAEHARKVERALRALLASCSTRGDASAASPEAWRAGDATLHITARYAKPARVRTHAGEIEVDEILFAPLAGDFVHARRGAELLAFAKWRPEAEAALVCDPSLGLGGHARIRELCARANPR